MVFLDEDNFQPIWNGTNIYNLRSDGPGPWLRFEDLDQPAVSSALTAVYTAARETPAFKKARAASERLLRSESLRLTFARLARQGHDQLNQVLQESQIGQAHERGLSVLRELYAGTPVEDIVQEFRRYNKLVQQIIWTILGLAEVVPEPIVIRDVTGTVRCTFDDGGAPFVRLTSTDFGAWVFRLTHPIQVAVGLPLDGLYNLVGFTMAFASGAANDFSLVPLSWAAGQWPPTNRLESHEGTDA